MNKVKLKVSTIQTIDNANNEDTIQLITEGTIDKDDECFIINYDESDITETKGSKTRLKIYENKMLMVKIGNFSSKMEFQENVNYNTIYTTPYGAFNMDFLTTKYDYSLDINGRGIIYVEYKIIFAKSEEGFNKLKIEIF